MEKKSARPDGRKRFLDISKNVHFPKPPRGLKWKNRVF